MTHILTTDLPVVTSCVVPSGKYRIKLLYLIISRKSQEFFLPKLVMRLTRWWEMKQNIS